MALRPGDLNRRVEIRKKTTGPKPGGGPGLVTTWAVLGTAWAKVEGLGGREAVIGTSLEGITTYRITMRYREDFDPSAQLGYGSIDLNIRSMNDPDGRRDALVIVADTSSTQRTS